VLTRGAAEPAFDPAGEVAWATVEGDRVASWSAAGTPRTEWWNRLSANLSGRGTVNALAVGRRWVVAGVRDGGVRVLDAATGQPVPRPLDVGEPDAVLAAAVRPDDTLAVVGTQAGQLRAFALPAGELVTTSAHADAVTAAAFAPDGALLVTGSRDRTVKVWELAGTRPALARTVGGLPAAVRRLRFDPAGGRVLVLLHDDLAVRWLSLAAVGR
jgi:WD40 repeat protein